GVYCALVAGSDFQKGITLAVNHGGDSDSTGAITGNLLGALLGKVSIPGKYLEKLELVHLIEEIAGDLHASVWKKMTAHD
ncbi:MAG: ADP-ribosylglycohydrolase family protein, partial [Deltaproteobacteria bacterium]|nr:ADP-ribosylglycohydrolase family protein [Deltaproteobacteria bacterium]